MDTAFEWDEAKRLYNVEKHSIDFLDAKEIWAGKVAEFPSNQQDHNESRWLAIGECNGRLISVVFTYRDNKRRIISARVARKYERAYYNKETGGHEGQHD